MYTDLFGKKRFKVNLHTHTTRSDGKKSPEEAIEQYRQNGYDAIALTDHWCYGKSADANGLTVLSGAEYNIGGGDCRDGVYHIVGIGMRHEPSLTMQAGPQKIIDEIHAADGYAVLAHPAWSLNTPQQILALHGIDATEIYNAVSNAHMSRRPDSSLIVDMVAAEGLCLPLLATDDAHYYDGSDACSSFVMIEAESNSEADLLAALREGKFYASQGPEIHLYRDGDDVVVRCSPCQEIVFLSNVVWSRRAFEGDGLTEARYTPKDTECFVRAMATDAEGRMAWSQIIPLFNE